jgi:ABC-type proline/glycine betaine transport system substrate-binding protein
MPVIARGTSWLIGAATLLLLEPAFCADAPAAAPVKIAVFEFELEDITPAAAITKQSTSSASAIEQVGRAARAELSKSGRYTIVDTSKADAQPVLDKSLRDCDGCEAGIAQKLGADESMIGVVRRATQTDYYIVVQIRDAHTGKILDQQGANFAGGEEGWPTGVRMLIKHQVLATPQ